jgi:hypothetical protein
VELALGVRGFIFSMVVVDSRKGSCGENNITVFVEGTQREGWERGVDVHQ